MMALDTIVCGDALEVMAAMPADSVDLIAVDPPYYKTKNDWWDRQWDTPAGFLDWIGQLCEAWHRILRPNGSLYVFASPEMSDRVKSKISEWFNVLNRIVWVKGFAWNKGDELKPARVSEKALRRYYEAVEYIIFAEHYGSDGYAKGEAGYSAKCDQLRGFVFEPLRAYLDGERQRAGVNKEDINEWLGFRRLGGMAGRHYFSQSQWQLPTEEHYHKMRECLNSLNHGGEYLRREYEDLRREYEDLRRPFNASPERPYTDVWTFKTVSPYPGKHPCEKPLDLMEHIVTMSSKPGNVVFDCCCGNGTTLLAAMKQGRHWYGCDVEEKYVKRARERLGQVQMEMAL